jgi:hypothetical protein
LGDDDDDWGSDSAEDGQQRIEELTEAAKKLMASEELEKSTEDRLEIFYKFVEVFLISVLILYEISGLRCTCIEVCSHCWVYAYKLHVLCGGVESQGGGCVWSREGEGGGRGGGASRGQRQGCSSACRGAA